jgi:hypothetical protein
MRRVVDRVAWEVASVLAALGRAEPGASLHTPFGTVRVIGRSSRAVALKLEKPGPPWR